MIDQQADVELRTGERRHRQGLDAFGERRPATASASMRFVCRAPGRAPRRRHQPGRRERPARRDRSETAPAPRRHAGSPQAPRPARPPGHEPTPPAHRTRVQQPRPSSRPSAAPSPRRPPRECELLCMSAPSTIINPSPFTSTESGHPADTACLGRCHAPIKSRRHPRPATSDTTKGSQATQADGLKESQLAPVRTIPSMSDVTDGPNRNSKPRSGRGVTVAPLPPRCSCSSKRGQPPGGLLPRLGGDVTGRWPPRGRPDAAGSSRCSGASAPLAASTPAVAHPEHQPRHERRHTPPPSATIQRSSRRSPGWPRSRGRNLIDAAAGKSVLAGRGVSPAVSFV